MDRIEPRIHDEIKEYKEKFYNFTLRQWIFGILIVIITVPLYLFLTPIIGSNITGWIVIIIVIPIGFFGFIPIQGLNAEKIVFYWKRNYLNFSKPLLYKTEQDLLLEREEKKKKKVKKQRINKKEIKQLKKDEKIKQKEIKKERKRQRELALAKKKFGVNNTTSNFSLSEEEAQVLIKIANQFSGKEMNLNFEKEKNKKEK